MSSHDHVRRVREVTAEPQRLLSDLPQADHVGHSRVPLVTPPPAFVSMFTAALLYKIIFTLCTIMYLYM